MLNKDRIDSQNEIDRPELHGKTQVPAADPEETLQNVMDGLAESVLEMSDEELLAESRELGRDPKEEADNVRRILLNALKAAEKRLPSGASRSLSQKQSESLERAQRPASATAARR